MSVPCKSSLYTTQKWNQNTGDLWNLCIIEDDLLNLHSKYTTVFKNYAYSRKPYSDFEAMEGCKQTFELNDFVVKSVLNHLKALKIDAAG